jgi:hypothetical protein
MRTIERKVPEIEKFLLSGETKNRNNKKEEQTKRKPRKGQYCDID